MKPITFLGDSLIRLRGFPPNARAEAGYQLRELQKGNEPADWKPIATVGRGVRELRIRACQEPFGSSTGRQAATASLFFTLSGRRRGRRRKKTSSWRRAG